MFSPCTRAQPATFRRAPTGSEPSDLLGSPRVSHRPTFLNRILYFCSQFCIAVVDRQKQPESRLLHLQVSRHIVTRHQRSRVALKLLHALVPGSYLLTYKKK